MDRQFRFEPWTDSWIQIPLVVNDLTMEHSKRCEGRKGIQSVGLDRTSINCQVCWSFTARVFWVKSETFFHIEDIILSVEVPVSDPSKCSFNVSLGSYYYYRYSALGPVWAQTRTQSGDWYSSGMLHPGQVLKGRLPFLSPEVWGLLTWIRQPMRYHFQNLNSANGGF
jgi:hypothetical protein